MLNITSVLNGPAPTTVQVFLQGSRPTDDTKWVVLKLEGKVINKQPADTTVPGSITVSGSGLTSGHTANLSAAFTRANGQEIEGSNVVAIIPL